jgi:hypothetical protein
MKTQGIVGELDLKRRLIAIGRPSKFGGRRRWMEGAEENLCAGPLKKVRFFAFEIRSAEGVGSQCL